MVILINHFIRMVVQKIKIKINCLLKIWRNNSINETANPVKIISSLSEDTPISVIEPFQLSIDSYEIIKILHDKTDVKLIKNTITNKLGVLKKLKPKKENRLTEIKLLSDFKTLKIPGIINLEFCYIHNNISYICLEYVQNGDLFDFIEKQHVYETDYLLRTTINIAQQLCITLQFLHIHGYIHFDIKPDNILLDFHKEHPQEFETKLIDFEYCMYIGKDKPDLFYENVGTQHYIDPELLNANLLNKVSGKCCDIYSLAVTLWCVYFGKYPFYDGCSPFSQQNLPPKYKKYLKYDFFILLLDMMSIPQYKRPNIVEINQKLKKYV